MKKEICSLRDADDHRIREILLTLKSEKADKYNFTRVTLSVLYVRPQEKSLGGGRIGKYVFDYADEFISFLRELNLSSTYLNEIWKGFEENDIANELKVFLDVDGKDVIPGKEVEKLKKMYKK